MISLKVLGQDIVDEAGYFVYCEFGAEIWERRLGARVRYSQYTRILSESSRFSNSLGGPGGPGGGPGKIAKPGPPQYISWSSVPVTEHCLYRTGH